MAVVLLGVLAGLAIPTYVATVNASRLSLEMNQLASVARDSLALEPSSSQGSTLPTAADVTKALTELKVTPSWSSVATQSSLRVASLTSGSVSVDTADYASQTPNAVGLAMHSSTGGCVMAKAVRNQVTAWKYSTDLGANCDGYKALAGSGQSISYASSLPSAPASLSAAPAWSSVSVGSTSCAVTSSGNLECWGNNAGAAPITSAAWPTNLVAVAGAGNELCVLTSTGGVSCNLSGGWTTMSLPSTVQIAGDSQGLNTCMLLSSGSVYCMGSGTSGALGNGSTSNSPSTPVQVTGISTAVSISVGSSFGCAALQSGAVSCWGDDNNSALGDGAGIGDGTYSTVPKTVAGISTAISVSAGNNQACALLADGTVTCWGGDRSGFNGTPTAISSLSGAVAIASSYYSDCAMLAGGTVKCWGLPANIYSYSSGSYATAVSVSGTGTAQSIAGGFLNMCVTNTNGAVMCWGDNTYGQLGNGSTTTSATPVQVYGISSSLAASSVSAGWYSTCSVTSGGGASCWGSNSNGQLGDGTTTGQSAATTGVSGYVSSKVLKVSVGNNFACATTDLSGYTATVKCWGAGTSGQLGNGSSVDSTTPVSVGSGYVDVGVGAAYACALNIYSIPVCWGDNTYGQLGNNSTTASNVPVAPTGTWGVPLANANLTGRWVIKSLSVGAYHTCVVADQNNYTWVSGAAVLSSTTYSNAIRCWGWNFNGQVGITTTAITYKTAQTVTDASNNVLTGWSSVVAGNAHTCGLKSDGTVWCWGLGSGGEMGNGTTTATNRSPVQVSTVSGVTVLAAGQYHNCAQTASNIYCWGDNSAGELGDGTTTNRSTPVTMSGATSGLQATSGGLNYTCLVVSGSVRCVGMNSSSQLGDGTTSGYSASLVSSIQRSASINTGITTSGTAWNLWWSASATNGGGTISSYAASSTPAGLSCTTSGLTGCRVTGATANTVYSFKVIATNASGSSTAGP